MTVPAAPSPQTDSDVPEHCPGCGSEQPGFACRLCGWTFEDDPNRQREFDDRAWGVYVAAQLAHEQGLPVGNFWEPGIARCLYERCREVGRSDAEADLRLQLGLVVS